MTHRLRAALAVLAALAVTGSAFAPVAHAQVVSDDDSIRHAAAVNDMSVARLSTILRTDPTSALSPGGRLFYKDAVPTLQHRHRAAAAPFPLEETFALHSKLGSDRTIFLDFDGMLVSGTEWNAEGVPNGTYPAWSLDGNAGSFNTAEQTVIQNVWLQVSEDYAPFDVDVTTEDPGEAAIDRSGGGDQKYGAHALITPSTTAEASICGSPPSGGCGGVAFTDVFDDTSAHQDYQPAWVFPHELADNAKYIAEAATHEVGHQLSLNHDGTAQDPDYYAGHSPWAPIMGAGYDQPIVQWSKGDYAGANNHEDDLAKITSHGLSYRADEAGGSIATAAGSLPSGTAYVTTRGDQDFYDLGACAGSLTIDAEPAPVSPDLDIELRLYDGTGTLVDSDNPTSARVSGPDFCGQRDVREHPHQRPSRVVRRVRRRRRQRHRRKRLRRLRQHRRLHADEQLRDGRPGPDPDPDPVAPGAPTIGRASSGSRGGQVTATARWSAPLDDGGAAVDGYRVSATRWKHGSPVKTLSSNVLGPTTHAAKFLLPRGVWSFRVQARNAQGFGAFSQASKRVTAR